MSTPDVNAKRPFYKKWWVWVIVIFLVPGFVGALSNKSPAATATATDQQAAKTAPAKAEAPVQKPVASLTAVALFQAYTDNKIAAADKYEGNLVEVSGMIQSIDKDILGNPYVAIGADQLGLNNVQCMLSGSSVQAALSLKKGDRVKVLGTDNGEALGNIVLKDCSIE